MKFQKIIIVTPACALTVSAVATPKNKEHEVKFTVKVENVSSKDLQTAPDGSK